MDIDIFETILNDSDSGHADEICETEVPVTDHMVSVDSSTANASQLAFTSHIDDLYDCHIDNARDEYIRNIEDLSHDTDLDSMKFHADNALEASKSLDYWKESKIQAEIEVKNNSLFMESIDNQMDIMNRTEHELQSIVDGTYGKDISFGSSVLSDSSSEISFGNRYDDNTADFVKMMKEYNIEIPSNVDLTPNSDDTVTLERSVNGGMLSIDKSLCATRIDNALRDGKITEDECRKLKNKLYSC